MMIRPCRRPGLAPLELAMALPVLLLIVWGIFFAARAAAARVTTVTEVRRTAFAARANASPQAPLLLTHSPLDGLVQQTASMPVPSGPVGGPPLTANSACGVTGGTWDSKDVPFPPLATPCLPHLGPLAMIAGNLLAPLGNEPAIALGRLGTLAQDAALQGPCQASQYADQVMNGVLTSMEPFTAALGDVRTALQATEISLLAAQAAGLIPAPAIPSAEALVAALAAADQFVGVGQGALGVLQGGVMMALPQLPPIPMPPSVPVIPQVANDLVTFLKLANPLTAPEAATELAIEVALQVALNGLPILPPGVGQ
jgi:hypothetical protein